MKFALFDMDNSLFDYEGALRAGLQAIAAPGESPITAETSLWELDKQPHMNARMDLIKSQPCWWRNLHAIPMGLIVWDLAKSIGFHNQILTKGPNRKSRAWKEKVDCCQKHFGQDVDIFLTSARKGKGQVYGLTLYDDHVPYMEAWLEWRKRGLGIMPVTVENKDFKHERVIKYDGSIESIKEVKAKLIAVFNRNAGESF